MTKQFLSFLLAVALTFTVVSAVPVASKLDGGPIDTVFLRRDDSSGIDVPVDTVFLRDILERADATFLPPRRVLNTETRVDTDWLKAPTGN